MKPFLDDNFLLHSESAEKLYHTYVKELPIIDYHCHLPPGEIYDDKQYANLTKIWLDGDHYKWRAMRGNGIDEKYCTGSAGDYEKFEKWAETVPYTVRNPLYHWTHMELKNPFNVDRLLDKNSARDIYDHCTEKLQTSPFSCRNLLLNHKVEVLCSSDDPADDLDYHQKLKAEGFGIKVLPTFRTDNIVAIEDSNHYLDYLKKLGCSANKEINSFQDLKDVLAQRHQHFHDNGCVLSDQGMETMYAIEFTEQEISALFEQIKSGKTLSEDGCKKYKMAILHFLAELNHEKGWVQQYHIGAIRNNSDRMMHQLGPNTGFDSIGDDSYAKPLSAFLNQLDAENKLAKTILFNLDPGANEMIATMTGNFNDGTTAGKIQFGPAWWFLDQKDGMTKQIDVLSNMGLLSRFIGMVTDSRSFLSYSRHEYFRRLLCNLIAVDIENGELPADFDWLGKIVQDICYYNPKQYFNF